MFYLKKVNWKKIYYVSLMMKVRVFKSTFWPADPELFIKKLLKNLLHFNKKINKFFLNFKCFFLVLLTKLPNNT